jgi:hypothetical protein
MLERREKIIKEKPTREYLSDEFGIDSFSVGILMTYFDLVVMLNISFIPTIEFPYSTGDPLFIMPFPMSWQLSFLGCCPVAGTLLNIELLSGQRSTPLKKTLRRSALLASHSL